MSCTWPTYKHQHEKRVPEKFNSITQIRRRCNDKATRTTIAWSSKHGGQGQQRHLLGTLIRRHILHVDSRPRIDVIVCGFAEVGNCCQQVGGVGNSPLNCLCGSRPERMCIAAEKMEYNMTMTRIGPVQVGTSLQQGDDLRAPRIQRNAVQTHRRTKMCHKSPGSGCTCIERATACV